MRNEPENDNFTYKGKDGTTITVSREFKRECPVCKETKSIADFGFRKMKKDDVRWRDQPMCGLCRKQKSPSPRKRSAAA